MGNGNQHQQEPQTGNVYARVTTISGRRVVELCFSRSVPNGLAQMVCELDVHTWKSLVADIDRELDDKPGSVF